MSRSRKQDEWSEYRSSQRHSHLMRTVVGIVGTSWCGLKGPLVTGNYIARMETRCKNCVRAYHAEVMSGLA